MEKEDSLKKEKAPHHGDNVQRFRKLRGFKQADLAELLGYSSKWLGEQESKAVIEDKILQKIADQLQVHIDVLKNYTDDCEVQINYNGDQARSAGYRSTYTENVTENNDVEKFMDLIKPLYEEISKKNLENYKLKEEIRRLKN